MKKTVIKLIRSLYYWRAKGIHKKHRLLDPEGFKRITDMLSNFHQYGGKENIWQEYKLYSLEKELEKFKPLNILELGMGSSTCIFAEYVRNTPKARLTCVDENEYWLSNAARIAGISHDDPRFRLVLSDRSVCEGRDEVEIKYTWEIAEKFDMVFLDGPSSKIDGRDYTKVVNTNMLKLTEDLYPTVILVDTRTRTVEKMKQQLSNRYVVNDSEKKIQKIKYNYRFFPEFILKQMIIQE